MSDITFKCSNCDSDIAIDDSAGGQTAICPNCSNTVMIPMPGIKDGMQLGDFTVKKRLGIGGMGEVWLAEQVGMKRNVALKILAPALSTDKNFIDRFMSEVTLSAKLEHQNIVSAYAAGEDKGIKYLAMSFVDGCELEDRLKIDRMMSEKKALDIIKSLAGALKYAWNKFQIIHRDIKPANIMLDEDLEPKLMDMGISKSLSENTQLTMTGIIIGSPHYMSPEQGRAEVDLDFRADLYSLGVTLYQMVTGSVPYDATTAMGILSRHLTDPFPCPLTRNPQLTDGCAVLLEIMMAKSRDNRQASWEDLIEDIDLVLRGEFPRTARPEVGQSAIMQETRSQALSRKKITEPAPTAHTMVMENNPAAKKSSKLSLILINVAVIAILAIAGFWFMNNNRVAEVAEPQKTEIATIKEVAEVAEPQKTEIATIKPVAEVAEIKETKKIEPVAEVAEPEKINKKNFAIENLGLEMIFVKNGEFIMGRGKEEHSVTITKPYWIGKYEVTQKEFKTVMKSNPSQFKLKGDNKPVEKVSWFMAQKFCEALTEIEKKAGRLPKGYVYRLPTEAEWELAARGGVDNKEQTQFSGSDDLNEVAWFLVNSGDEIIGNNDYKLRDKNKCRTHEVGKKKPNALGLYDMSGNVCEWCLDMAMHPKDAKKANTTITKTYVDGIIDPLSKEGKNRIRRGGSWRYGAGYCNVAKRYSEFGPSHANFYIGFRIVLASSPK